MDILLTCFVNTSGLSRVARNYFRVLDSFGFRIVVSSLSPADRNGLNPEIFNKMMSAARRPLGKDFIQLHVGNMPQGMRYAIGRRALFASTVFEGHALTKDQHVACMTMNSVMVPSMFCRNVCLTSGIPKSKVAYVPYALDESIWNPSVQPLLLPSSKFRFLYLNTWYERKGWDVLLKAWWSEFRKDDNVELVIKSTMETTRLKPIKDSITEKAIELGIDLDQTAPIRVIDRIMTDDELPGFMKSHDAFVSPHRSEGFGMNPWHAMALGVPVIATAYGGVLDFCSDDTSWLVKVDKMVSPSIEETSIFSQFEGIRWAEPDVTHLGTQMRICMTDSEARRQKAENGAKRLIQRYSDKKVLDAFKDAIGDVDPEIWKHLCFSVNADKIVNVEAPRYDPGHPIKFAEI